MFVIHILLFPKTLVSSPLILHFRQSVLPKSTLLPFCLCTPTSVKHRRSSHVVFDCHAGATIRIRMLQ